MKLLFIGDAHLASYSSFATIDPETGINSRLKSGLAVLEEIASIRDRLRADLTLFGGDIFHTRKNTPNETVALVAEALYRLWPDRDSVYYLVGNHDMWSSKATDTILKILKPIGHVIDRPYHEILSDGSRFYAWPYTHDIETLKAQMAEVKDADLVLFHQGLNEAVIGAYHISIPSALSLKDLPKARFIGGSHYHLPQVVQDDPPVLYIGSITQTDMSEREEAKRVVILDTQTWEFTSIPLQSGPQFHLYDSITAAQSGKHRECDFVRIQCREAEAEAAKAQFPKAQIEVTKELVTERRVITQETTSNDALLLEAFLNEKKPGVDKERLLKLGLELLNEAD